MNAYTYESAKELSLKYFEGDSLAADVYLTKYALRNKENLILEPTPAYMHMRIAKEFARVEQKFASPLSLKEIFKLLSDVDHLSDEEIEAASEDELIQASRGFGRIIPQGSPLSGIGNHDQIQSLSNCFVIDSPHDSYGGILKTDQEEAQIMKRRGGVGFDISNIRPKGMPTSNAARTTTGIGTFMERFSNTCREVGQDGRRGALMLTISCFEGSVRVLTEEGWLRVDEVVEGRYGGKVWTHEGWKEIEAYQRFENRDVFIVESEDGKSIATTIDHEFMVKNNTSGEEYLKPLGQIDGDVEELIVYNAVYPHTELVKAYTKISSIIEAGTTTVYDFTVKDTHRILANGFYTSNCNHPEIDTFINIKRDKSKVTGANISVRYSDEFMRAVKSDSEYVLRWPVDASPENAKYTRTVKAKEIWRQMTDAAWYSAEPGVLFWDTVLRNTPADAYKTKGFNTISTNPCAELLLSQNDSCRLLVVDLSKFVSSPFVSPEFMIGEYAKTVRFAQRLMDDLVELEIESVDKILAKIQDDPEDYDVKSVEYKLWTKIRTAATDGRRTGTGLTAVGDCLAMLNVRYGSDESLKLVEDFYQLLAENAYKATIELAKDRGAFPAYDYELEKDHDFIKRVITSCGHETIEMYKQYGRRNIALTTTAPVGSVSAVLRTSSGIEPVFQPIYKRRRKINPGDAITKVDFIDDLGDKWQEYDVYHEGVKKWMSITGQTDVTKSPYFGADSASVNWDTGVQIQAKAQKWICHAISRTANFPKSAKHSEISDVYLNAWESGCKGFTVYREGARSGVLLTNNEFKSWFDGVENSEIQEMIDVYDLNNENMPSAHADFIQIARDELAKRSGTYDNRPVSILDSHSPKRPKELECDIHRVNVAGEIYLVLVGLLGKKPYEIFAGLSQHVEIPKKIKKGYLVKNGKKDGIVTYNLIIRLNDEDDLTFRDIVNLFDNPVYGALTRTISLALRHGVAVNYIAEQLKKDKHSDITSFSSSIARVLSKGYIADGTKSFAEKKCESCGAATLVYQQGCVSCASCGYSKC